MAATRQMVYDALDSERDYQDSRWHVGTTPSAGQHETGAFILYMEEYLARARELSSTMADGDTNENGEEALDFVRKVTALGVACMEQNGAPKR